MNVIQEIKRINERELELGVTNGNGSWHDKYKNSAWVFVGGLPYELTEGDIVCFMSQWGEIEDVNYVRDKETGKPKGFCFVKYEDQRSTILAVDNFNGIELVSRTLRVDHVDKYRLPKEVQEREDALEAEMADEEKRDQRSKFAPGHAYKGKQLETKYDLSQGQDLFKSPDDIEHEEKAKAKLQKSAKKRKKEEKKLKKKQEKKEKKKRKKEKETQQQHEGSLGSASSGLQQGDTMQENKENNIREDLKDQRVLCPSRVGEVAWTQLAHQAAVPLAVGVKVDIKEAGVEDTREVEVTLVEGFLPQQALVLAEEEQGTKITTYCKLSGIKPMVE
eukprot:CAMPEP_0117810632 /NCGR_PEP_ID=MMETSP0948-20121206/21557_1 /TAXON_ID=44440 /ORGANISM="Chattonella subsalsa, Strain CCMP2191" /LENGTH=332 /DNA_ID=CAMNT_0005646891 /DNA_START=92 /DNA_END=1090 /DNA_ORIENTATION=+